MKKSLFAMAALAALVSCQSLKEEWQPVFTNDYGGSWVTPVSEEYLQENYGLETISTIAELKALYTGSPIIVSGNVWIKGQVVSSDVNGNIYREMYVQDKTGAIDLKLGNGNLSALYPQGMYVYVKCDGLTLGAYSGAPQLGYVADDTSDSYETSYIGLQSIIDQHVFRGFTDVLPAPQAVTEDALKTSLAKGFQGELWGKLVSIKGLQYGADPQYNTDEYKRIFLFTNVDPFKDKNATSNRMRMSSNTYGVTTWAMSKNKFIEYLDNGNFDEASTYDNVGMNQLFDEATGLTVKQTLRNNAAAMTISQVFHLGSTYVAIRTSGYARFADVEMDPAIIGTLTEKDGTLIDVTGILSTYNGQAQLTLIDDPSISVVLQ